VSIAATCPRCDRAGRVPDRAAGTKIKCPGCGRSFTVPPFADPVVYAQAILDAEPAEDPPPRRALAVVAADPPKSKAVAAVLEAVPGIFQVFGIGHLYAGNLVIGLAVLFGYWFVLAVNLALCLVVIGFVTGPLCWLAAMIASPLLAARSVRDS
jgi:hypothetical protein